MKYLTITYPDINNGPGFRATLWIAGCSHHCPGCHNQHTWDYNQGLELTSPKLKEQITKIFSNDYISGLTISGGDPLDQSANSLHELCDFMKWFKLTYPSKTIWLYTGFNKDEVISYYGKYAISLADYLIDGKYDEKLRDTSLAFRGSSNQHIIKIHKD